MINIKNIGPIESVSIPVPAEGGVVVLHGRNGSGKSTALDAIQSAVTGKGKPPLKDKAAKGEVHAGGVTLTVAKSVRRAGELTVTALDGRLSIADLVEPGINDPLRADASRIKALVNLSGAAIEPGDLHGFPENLLEGLNLADPVAAMAELKRRLDIGAREYEKLATDASAKAGALLEAAPAESAAAPDEATLSAALSAAQRRVDRLADMAEQATAAQARAAQAQAKLATVEREDVASLELANRNAEVNAVNLRSRAEKLKIEYNEAVNAYKDATAEKSICQAQLEHARQADVLRAQLEQQIAESMIPAPTSEELDAAQTDLNAAQQAISDASRQRVAMDTRRKGLEMAEEAERLEQESVGLRRKARQTEELLSEIIADLGCPLRCIDGRLVTDTGRGPTYYAELSEGERWKLALDIAVQAVGQGGLIVVPQAAWEGLDPVNRSLIATHAKASGVVVVTAEADDGELAATEY
jgi:energy-coupling factor transporter ATP-binding protein EcfA2